MDNNDFNINTIFNIFFSTAINGNSFNHYFMFEKLIISATAHRKKFKVTQFLRHFQCYCFSLLTASK